MKSETKMLSATLVSSKLPLDRILSPDKSLSNFLTLNSSHVDRPVDYEDFTNSRIFRESFNKVNISCSKPLSFTFSPIVKWNYDKIFLLDSFFHSRLAFQPW